MDILLAFGTPGADLAVASGDLLTDNGLLTAVVVSLFTNRQAEPGDELPAGETDRQGWWADATLPRLTGASDKIGSRLWLLRREKQLPEVVARAREYATEALQWLLTERRVDGLTVTATVPERGHLQLQVALEVDGATQLSAFDYSYLTGAYRLSV